MHEASARRAFWTCASVLVLALWSSAAPTALYPSYSEAWNLEPVWTTAVFAAYPTGLVVVLTLFGTFAERLGQWRNMVIGVAVVTGAAVVFATAPSVEWLLAARVLMGVGVGLALSPATAGMLEAAGTGRAGRAGSIATAATAMGLIVGTLLGGAGVEAGVDPIHLPYWPLVIAGVLLLVAALRLPRDRVRPVRESPTRGPGGTRSALPVAVVATSCIGTAYVLGAVVLSLDSNIEVAFVDSGSPLVNSAVLAISPAAIGITAVLSQRLAAASTVSIGAGCTLVGAGLLLAAAAQQSLIAYLGFAAVGGAGYALLFSAGVALVGSSTDADHSAGTFSRVFLVCYLLQGAAALGLGAIATATSLAAAVSAAVAMTAPLAIAALVGVLIITMRSRTDGATVAGGTPQSDGGAEPR